MAPLVVAPDYGDQGQISAAVWDGGTTHRRVYPLSVAPGGVYSAAEVETARRADPVIAAHYEGLNIPRLRRVVLDEPILRYISFRRGNRVYWTRERLPIPRGETVLADGDSAVRARCGNRLSELPGEPVLPLTERQPTVVDFEIPLPREAAPTPVVTTSAPGTRVVGDEGRCSPENGEGDRGTSGPTTGGTCPAQVPDSGVESPSSERATGTGLDDNARSTPRGSGRAYAGYGFAPGFGGFSVLGSRLGGGVPAPSHNPALVGSGAVTAMDPDLFLPSPAQVLPQLPPADDSLSANMTESVFALLNPFGSGSPSPYVAALPYDPPPGASAAMSAVQMPLWPPGSGLFGSPLPRSVEAAQLMPLWWLPFSSQISSAGVVPPLIPGLPLSAVLFTTAQNPGPIYLAVETRRSDGSSGGSGAAAQPATDGKLEVPAPDTAVPEPWTVALTVSGLLVLRRMRRSRAV